MLMGLNLMELRHLLNRGKEIVANLVNKEKGYIFIINKNIVLNKNINIICKKNKNEFN